MKTGLLRKLFTCKLRIAFAILLAVPAVYANKAVSVQMKIRDSSGELVSSSSASVRVLVLSESFNGVNCVLRDENFSSVSIDKGYLSIPIGTGTRGSLDPNKSLGIIFSNNQAINGLNCLDSSGSVNGSVTSYTPGFDDVRSFKVTINYSGQDVVVNFKNRVAPYAAASDRAADADKLSGKSASEFVQIPSGQPNYQSRVNDLVSDSGNAIMSQILAGTYAIPTSRVTGLGPLATISPTGTASASTYLRGDGSWAPISGSAGGTVTDVSGTAPISVATGTSTPVISISDATTSAKGAVQVGAGLAVTSGVVSLADTGTAGTYGSNYQVPVITTDAKGRVTGVTATSITINGSAITAGTIDEARIPTLDAAKIGTGTIATARLPATLVYSGQTGSVGLGAAADATAILALSSTTKGFLAPRMTTTERDAITTPATGLQIYNTTTNKINFYNGSSWAALDSSGTSGVTSITAGTGLTGGTITSTGTVSVDVGTTANKIVQLDGSARLPAVDASLLTGITASQVPSLDAAKITTGTIPIARGGTNSGTTLNNNRVMISSSGAIVENAAITASRALASDANGLPVASSVTDTELGYLSGVTSSVQTQIGNLSTSVSGKASSSGWTNYSVITSNGSGALTAVPGSSAGQMLNWTVTGPAWTTATFPTSTMANQLLYSSADNVVGGLTTANNAILTTNGSGVPSWTALSGDAFTQYALLAGRSGGQTINGGTAASNSLTLDSTSNATKGNIILNPTGGNVGIGTTSPTFILETSANSPALFNRNYSADGNTSRNALLLTRTNASGPGDDGIGVHIDLRAETKTEGLVQDVGQFRAFARDATSGLVDSEIWLSPYLDGVRQDGALTIKASGNVGIGTTEPNAKLESVQSSSRYVRINDQTEGGNFPTGTRSTFRADDNGSVTPIVFENLDSTASTAHSVHLLSRMSYTSGANAPVAAGRISFIKEQEWTSTASTQDSSLQLSSTLDGVQGAKMTIRSNGNVGIGTTLPAATLHLKAGTAAANTAPLKLTAGTNLTTPEAGAIEFDGTTLYYTDSTNTRRALASTTGTSSISNSTGNITLSPVTSTGSVIVDSGTASSGTTSGSLVVSGGVGVSGAINAGGNVAASGAISSGSNITATGNITGANIYASNFYLANSGTTDAGTWGFSNTNGPAIQMWGIGSANTGSMFLQTAGTTRMAIDQNGRVGVGTTAPVANLHINGGDNTTLSTTNLNYPSSATAYVTHQMNSGTITNLAASVNTMGEFSQYLLDPSAAVNSAFLGNQISIVTPPTASFNNSSTSMGMLSRVRDFSSVGTTGFMTGGQFVTQFLGAATRGSLTGVAGNAQISNYNSTNQASTVGTITGGSFFGGNASTGGTVTTSVTGVSASASNSGTTPNIYGFTASSVNNAGATTSTSVIGGSVTATNRGTAGSIRALIVDAGQDTTGTITNQTSIDAFSYVYAGGTTTNQYGVAAQTGTCCSAVVSNVTNSTAGMFAVNNYNSGTITNAHGVDISINGSNVTNGYGLRIGGNTATNKWALYQTDANSRNYFAGKVGLSNSNPRTDLHMMSYDTNLGPIFRMSNAYYPPSSGIAGILQFTFGEGITEGTDHFRLAEIRGIRNGVTNAGAIAFYTNSDYIGTTPLEQVRITGDGRVGIGTASPTTKLHILSGDPAILIENSSATSNSLLKVKNPSRTWQIGLRGSDLSDSLAIRNETNSIDALVINTSGNIGIGTTSPGEKLEVNGNVKATSFISTSDERLKNNIRDVAGLQTIDQISGVQWNWKENGKTDYGVIAQQVEKVMPEAVVTNETTGFKGVKYQALFAPLIQAVKEIKQWLLSHDESIAKIQQENQKLKSENEAIKAWLCQKDPNAPFCK